jgi:SAM-dependent methyltransferase
MTKALVSEAQRKKRLRELEAIVEADMLAFVRVGSALLEISRDRLFEPQYGTFGEYLEDRWHWEGRHGYRQMNASVAYGYLAENCPNGQFLPTSEGAIRPLTKLATFKQVEMGKKDPAIWARAWKAACSLAKKDGRPPTDRHVEEAVSQIIRNEKVSHLPDPSPWKGQDGLFVGNATSTKWLDDLPAEVFDLVLTDPPWSEDSIGTYAAVGRAALKGLRPGGVCVIYLGKIYLPEVIRAVNEYLDYEWTFALTFPVGQVVIRKAAVYDCWRPVGIFRKPGPFDLPPVDRDLMPAPREKGTHDWQQALDPARFFVRRYTQPGSLVLDPFIGGGTFPLAALLEGRRYIGFDIEADAVKAAQERLRSGD